MSYDLVDLPGSSVEERVRFVQEGNGLETRQRRGVSASTRTERLLYAVFQHKSVGSSRVVLGYTAVKFDKFFSREEVSHGSESG